MEGQGGEGKFLEVTRVGRASKKKLATYLKL